MVLLQQPPRTQRFATAGVRREQFAERFRQPYSDFARLQQQHGPADLLRDGLCGRVPEHPSADRLREHGDSAHGRDSHHLGYGVGWLGEEHSPVLDLAVQIAPGATTIVGGNTGTGTPGGAAGIPGPSPLPLPQNYYVDHTNGRDTNPGNIKFPWQTVTHVSDALAGQVSGVTINPGATIHFLRGDTFPGNLVCGLSVYLDAPITFTDYGSAVQAPIISAVPARAFASRMQGISLSLTWKSWETINRPACFRPPATALNSPTRAGSTRAPSPFRKLRFAVLAEVPCCKAQAATG